MNPFGERSSTQHMYIDPNHLQPATMTSSQMKVSFANHSYTGPKQPAMYIDVFLEPLLRDMKKLWDEGFRMWDAYHKSTSYSEPLFLLPSMTILRYLPWIVISKGRHVVWSGSIQLHSCSFLEVRKKCTCTINTSHWSLTGFARWKNVLTNTIEKDGAP